MQPSISSFDMVIFTEHTTTGAGPGPIHDPCCSYAAPILTPTNIIVKMFRIIQIENVRKGLEVKFATCALMLSLWCVLRDYYNL